MRFRGVSVAPGTAAGVLRVARDLAFSGTAGDGAVSATAEDVEAAFAAVAAERSELAAKLRAAGREDEAAIIEISGLIAADPALSAPAVDAVRGGEDPAAAVRASAEQQAAAMERLSSPELAARAGDIRQVATAVVDFLRTNTGEAGERIEHAGGTSGGAGGSSPLKEQSGGAGGSSPLKEHFILVRREVSPAELIELSDNGLVGAVSVVGGASSHAAIIARGLGVPMISSADPAVLDAHSGQPATLDADAGDLFVGAEAHTVASTTPAAPVTTGPVRTADGTEITVLCNVASVAETKLGLAAGAEGVGLLRTEIPYTQARDWPSYEQQRAQLAPILALLAGQAATVRLLDFSGDKIPPFLGGREGGAGNGLDALLSHPSALSDQLRAIIDTGRDTRLAVLIPMVRALSDISRVREVLTRTAADAGAPLPRLGIMVELAATAAHAEDFAPAVDFFSIGTNDLAGDVLDLRRDDPAAGPRLAADPRVLDLVRHVAHAGRDAGIGVSVCGDAAADLGVLPLLIAAGIRAVSVSAARVATVRSEIRGARA